MGDYSRERVLRLLKMTEGRLRYWERRGLAPRARSYSLGELAELRRLARLTKLGLKLSGLVVSVFRQRWVGCSQGRPLVRDAVGLVELGSRQGVFDFEPPGGVQELRPDGVLMLREGRHLEALHFFQQALRTQPWSVTHRFNLALALEGLERLPEAEAELGKILAMCPGHSDSHYNRARLLEMLGRSAEARRHWQSFLHLEPDSDWAEGVRRFLAQQRPLQLVPCP